MLLAEQPAAGPPRVTFLRRTEGGVGVCRADVAVLAGPDVDSLRAAVPAAHAALVDDVSDLSRRIHFGAVFGGGLVLARENGPAAAAADTGNEPASAETTPLRGAGTGLPTALRVLDGPSLLCSSDAGTSLLRRDRGPIHVAAPMLVLADAARAGCGVDWHVLVLPRDPRAAAAEPRPWTVDVGLGAGGGETMALHCRCAPPGAASAALVQGPPPLGDRSAPLAVTVGGSPAAPAAALHRGDRAGAWHTLARLPLPPSQAWTVAMAAWTGPATAAVVVASSCGARLLRFRVSSSRQCAEACCEQALASGPDAFFPVVDPAGYCCAVLALAPGEARCVALGAGFVESGAEAAAPAASGEGRVRMEAASSGGKGKRSRKRGRPKALEAVLEELRGGSRASALRVARAVHALAHCEDAVVAARAAVARLSAHLSCALPLRWPSRHQGAAALGASARESEAWASWTAGMQALPTAEGAQPSSAAPPPPPPPRRSSRPRPPRCAVTLMEHTVPLPGGATALEVRDELVVGSAQWRACTVGDAELAAVCEVCTERRVRARFAWGRAPSDEHMGDVALLPLRSHHVALSATALGHCSQGPAQGPAALVPAATASVPLAALLRAAGMEEAEEGEEGDDAWGGITVPLDAGAAEGPTLEAATAGLPAHAVTAAVSCCAVLLSVPGPPQRAAQATGHRGPRTAAIGEDDLLPPPRHPLAALALTGTGSGFHACTRLGAHCGAAVVSCARISPPAFVGACPYKPITAPSGRASMGGMHAFVALSGGGVQQLARAPDWPARPGPWIAALQSAAAASGEGALPPLGSAHPTEDVRGAEAALSALLALAHAKNRAVADAMAVADWCLALEGADATVARAASW